MNLHTHLRTHFKEWFIPPNPPTSFMEWADFLLHFIFVVVVPGGLLIIMAKMALKRFFD